MAETDDRPCEQHERFVIIAANTTPTGTVSLILGFIASSQVCWSPTYAIIGGDLSPLGNYWRKKHY